MKSFQIKKLAASTIAAATFVVMTPAAQAANVSSAFNVNINLTPACSVSTAAGNITMTYIDNDPAGVTGTSTVGVTCTSGAPYTLSLDGLIGLGAYGPFADAETGLNYTMSFDGTGVGGADVALVGSGVEIVTTIGANIAGPQSGICNGNMVAGVCTSLVPEAHTVFVNY